MVHRRDVLSASAAVLATPAPTRGAPAPGRGHPDVAVVGAGVFSAFTALA